MNAQNVIVTVRVAVVLVAAYGALATGRGSAEIIGNWDFSGGWNSSTGEIAGVAGSQARLRYLSQTDIYASYKPRYEYGVSLGLAASILPNPPALQFVTGTVGGESRTVLRVPNAKGYGDVTGLVADFEPLTAGKVSRYTLIMDVLVPESSFSDSPRWLNLFQPRANADGLLFVDKQNRAVGKGLAYSDANSFSSNEWQRVALVVDLTAPSGQPHYMTYLKGLPAKSVEWVTDNAAQHEANGPWSIGSLEDSNYLGLLDGVTDRSRSTFFLFNDDNDEIGELYIANLQFHDAALSAADILSLGGPTATAIAVPEPTTIAGLASATITIAYV
ncbi:MAG: hypothetical protein WCJ18_11255, partial [Planctomycetota bacterium]